MFVFGSGILSHSLLNAGLFDEIRLALLFRSSRFRHNSRIVAVWKLLNMKHRGTPSKPNYRCQMTRQPAGSASKVFLVRV